MERLLLDAESADKRISELENRIAILLAVNEELRQVIVKSAAKNQRKEKWEVAYTHGQKELRRVS